MEREGLGGTGVLHCGDPTRRAMSAYHRVRPFLFRLEAERAHRWSVAAARVAQRLAPPLLERAYAFESERLCVRVLGLCFPNPLGLAAGLDKNGVIVRFWRLAGFGHVEVGSVSALKAGGNRRPRAFRLPGDEALVNRMGLGNQGADRVARRLARLPPDPRPLGISLARTSDPAIAGSAAVEDFVAGFRRLAPLAGYVVLNLSCPNTPDGQTFEDPNALDDLLSAVDPVLREVAPGTPLLLKLSPPLSERVVLDSAVDEVVSVGSAHGVSGYVACNTAADREGLRTPAERLVRIGPGGVSGRPLEGRATRLVRYLRRRTEGRVPIIGVGGVFDADDAYRKIRAGASLVQLYTGLVYEGPGLVARIKRGLVDRLDRDGLATVADAVGLDA